MSNWLKYALVGAGCSFITGVAGAAGMYIAHQRGYENGYDKGYNESEPEVLILNQETHGIEGLCVIKNTDEMICAADVNYDGAVDVVTIDIETQQIKNVIAGKDNCVNKYLRNLEEIQKQQEL